MKTYVVYQQNVYKNYFDFLMFIRSNSIKHDIFTFVGVSPFKPIINFIDNLCALNRV